MIGSPQQNQKLSHNDVTRHANATALDATLMPTTEALWRLDYCSLHIKLSRSPASCETIAETVMMVESRARTFL